MAKRAGWRGMVCDERREGERMRSASWRKRKQDEIEVEGPESEVGKMIRVLSWWRQSEIERPSPCKEEAEEGSWEEEGSGAPIVQRRGTWCRRRKEQQQGGSADVGVKTAWASGARRGDTPTRL
jgi:hypothetical protein